MEPGVIQDVLAAGSHLQLLELLSLCSHYLIQVCELASCRYALSVLSPAVMSCTPPAGARWQVKGKRGDVACGGRISPGHRLRGSQEGSGVLLSPTLPAHPRSPLPSGSRAGQHHAWHWLLGSKKVTLGRGQDLERCCLVLEITTNAWKVG